MPAPWRLLAASALLLLGLGGCGGAPASGNDPRLVDARVATGSDDAEERASGSVNLTSRDLEMVDRDGMQTIGLRFSRVDVAAGATIARAHVQFTADAASTGDAELLVRAEASDDAPRLTTRFRDLSLRTTTGAEVVWRPPPWTRPGLAMSDQRSVDLTPLVQEIVDRPGWRRGNALVLLITGSGLREARSYEAGVRSAAVLTVKVGDPRPPANQAPVVVAGPDRTARPGDPVAIAGSVSDDGLPGAGLEIAWTAQAGPGAVSFDPPDRAETVATFATPGTYTLRLTASDGELAASDDVDVVVAEAPPPAPDVTLPARGAFYYPWFPETWTVNGAHVAYRPSLGYYDSADASVVDAHLAALDRAGVDVAIASWWGPGTHDEGTRIPLLLDRAQALGSAVRWSLYYEAESQGDPSVETLRSDLAYLAENYATAPAFARVDGEPVLFVYNADDADCEVVDRWLDAAADAWYLVLKVFPGYADCAAQPSAWHQYAPAVATDHQSGSSYTVSPGFWRADEASPRLARDLDRWERNVRDMVASGEPWQLVTTFNEWGEGTAIEAAEEWGTAYLDVLARDGRPDGTPGVTVAIAPSSVRLAPSATTPFTATVSGADETGVDWTASGGTLSGTGSTVTYTAPASAGRYTVTATSVADPEASAVATVEVAEVIDAVTVVAAGDIACDPQSGSYEGGAGTASSCHMRATSDLVLSLAPDAVLLLGDNQYEDGELAAYLESYAPSWGRFKDVTWPTPGNHEYHTPGAAGYFAYFGARAGDPDEGYYAFDLGAWHIVALNSNCSDVGGCDAGSPQETWLREDLAASTAQCTLAYMHHPRFSSGDHGDSSRVGPLWQALHDAGAELALAGHDHTYERFAPMTPAGDADPSTGIRSFVVGTGGKNHYDIGTPRAHSEFQDDRSYGVLKLELDEGGYRWAFVDEAGATLDAGSGACHDGGG